MSGKDKVQIEERLESVGWTLQDDETLRPPLLYAVAMSTQTFSLDDADALNDVLEVTTQGVT